MVVVVDVVVDGPVVVFDVVVVVEVMVLIGIVVGNLDIVEVEVVVVGAGVTVQV